MRKVGFIGLGNMGSAIAKGLKAGLKDIDLYGYDSSQEASENAKHYMTIASSEEELVRLSEIVILAVKPDVIVKSAEKIKNVINEKCLVSIAAGVKLESIEAACSPEVSIIRIMPNTPALVSEGMCVISPNASATQEEISEVQSLFSIIGKTLILQEKYIDAVTAMSGCGPAYAFTMIQAMADAGVKLGLTRKDATLLASQTLKGSAEMVMKTSQDPIALRNMVTSPGGSTIAAVHVMERSAFSGIMMDAIDKAAEVSAKLGVKK